MMNAKAKRKFLKKKMSNEFKMDNFGAFGIPGRLVDCEHKKVKKVNKTHIFCLHCLKNLTSIKGV